MLLGVFVSQEGLGQIIYPELTRVELLDQLRDDYSPNSVLSLDRAKDTIYSSIDNVGGTVSTIYCDHSLDLPNGVDPSRWMFDGPNGGRGAEAINLEHVYPRSKGAQDGSQASSDMHHLYPSRASVNGDRASFPFAEISDNQTSKWYLFTNVLTNPPATNRDLYSEFVNGRFEPRESKKGDIARAVFYFYTIYENRALSSDPDFFESMRSTLCDWHIEDEIDQGEILRSQKIANHQGNQNPFVLDCTLATRSYCIDEDVICREISGIDQLEIVKDIKAYYSADYLNIEWYSNDDGFIQISLFNATGQLVHTDEIIEIYSGENKIKEKIGVLNTGIYFIQLSQTSSNRVQSKSVPIYVQK